MIWFKKYTISEIEWMSKGNMVDHIGIQLTEIGTDYITGKMSVDDRTRQPMGVLHGGASAALAETLGSIASNLIVDPDKFYCVGMEINANHIRPVKEGFVYGTAKLIHAGKSTHIWNIEIKNEEKKLVCISRLTMAVKSK